MSSQDAVLAVAFCDFQRTDRPPAATGQCKVNTIAQGVIYGPAVEPVDRVDANILLYCSDFFGHEGK